MLGRVAITLLQRSMLERGIGVRSVVSVGRQQLSGAGRETLARDVRYAYLGHVPDLTALVAFEAKGEPDLVIQLKGSMTLP